MPDPKRTAQLLKRLCPLQPRLAIVLGSGFQSILTGFRSVTDIPYRRLPGFPQPSVPGHAGRVTAGYLLGTPLLLLAGRGHYYEGFSLAEITFPIRVLAHFGIKDLVLTNAAGGIRSGLRPGDFLLVRDHINGLGANPLRGSVSAGLDRFVDLSQTYEPRLRALFKRAAGQVGLRVAEGVYLAVPGPSYETPAEIRAFARWGVDAIGMSTVPEAIVARQHHLAVAALCCITNRAAGRNPAPLSHREVLQTGRAAGVKARKLLRAFAKLYGKENFIKSQIHG